MNRAAAWGIPLVLASMFFCFHREAFFEGKVYQNQWIFRNHAPFPKAAPEELNPANRSSDLVTHYFPYKAFIARCLEARKAPLWNPQVFCGFPLFANGSSAVFSPWHLLLSRMGPYQAYNLYLAVVFLLGGFALFRFLSGPARLGGAGAFAGAAAYMLCPFLVQNLDYDSSLGFLWVLPLVLLLCELDAGRWKARERAALTALVLAGAGIASHVHVVLNALILLFSYRLFCGRERPAAARMGVPMGAGLLAALMALPLLVPTAQFLRLSQWGPAASTGSWEPALPLTPLTAVFPVFLPLAERFGFGRSFPMGLLPFLLALTALTYFFDRGVDRRLKVFTVLWTIFHLSTVLPLGSLVPGAAGHLLDAALSKFWMIYVLSSSVLCGFAVDSFVRDERWRRRLGGVLSAAAALVVLPVILLSAALTFRPEALRSLALGFLEKGGYTAGQGSAFAEKFERVFAELVPQLSLSSLHILFPATCVVGLLAVLFYGRRKTEGRVRLAVAAMLCLMIADLFVTGAFARIPPVAPDKVYPRTAITDFLRADKSVYRTLSLQTEARPGQGAQRYVLKPNLGIPYGLSDVGGQDSILDARYLFFAKKFLGAEPGYRFRNEGILDFKDFNPAIASFLNVKYVLAGEEREVMRDGFREVLRADGLRVYENQNVLPRLFFTSDVRPAGSDESIFGAMGRPEALEKRTVWAEAAGVELPAPSEGDAGTVENVFIEAGRATARCDARKTGLLVFTDNFHDGWRAYDNGKKAPLVRVNALFKGVWLEPGVHEVRFEYAPDAFWGPLKFSLFGFLVCLALLGPRLRCIFRVK